MTCIQKEGETRIIIDHHTPIIRIPDETRIIIDHHTPIIRISDRLWDEFKKILPKEKPSKTVGRPIIPYRKVLDGILYILRTEGCQWKILLKEYSSGSTFYRRFQEWNNLDLFKKIWLKLLKIYDRDGYQLDLAVS